MIKSYIFVHKTQLNIFFFDTWYKLQSCVSPQDVKNFAPNKVISKRLTTKTLSEIKSVVIYD